MKVLWRYTTTVDGGLYVIMDGMNMMLTLCVDNLDLNQQK